MGYIRYCRKRCGGFVFGVIFFGKFWVLNKVEGDSRREGCCYIMCSLKFIFVMVMWYIGYCGLIFRGFVVEISFLNFRVRDRECR